MTSPSPYDGPHCLVYGTNRVASLKKKKATVEVQIPGPIPEETVDDVKIPSNLTSAGDIVLGAIRKEILGRQRLRWNLLFNLIMWIVLPLPLWLPFLDSYYGTTLTLYVVPAVQCVFMGFFLLVTVLAVRTVAIMYYNRNTDFMRKIAKTHGKKTIPEKVDIERGDETTKTEAEGGESGLQHMAVLSCYKEPLDLIVATVETLANQTVAHKVTMVVSLEEKTPDLLTKQGQLCDIFGTRFYEILFSIHPSDVEGEIPGKCSNSNCGLRTGLAHIAKREGPAFDAAKVLITTADADSKFHPRYLEALEWRYLTVKNSENCIYQAPLLYNWELDAASFVTRVTGILRAFLMMGALIPLNINTMSIFSFSSSLCIAGDFVHPAYQMDDIIMLIRWMGVCKKRLRIIMVPVPVLSGPTSGRVIEEDLREWARQARRWTIGAGEVFHYFVVKSKNIPVFTALSWGFMFLFYYGIILCSSSLYGLVAGLSSAFLVGTFDVEYTDYLNWIMLIFLGIQYFVFLIVFVLDALTVRLIRPSVKEEISLVRNVIHWLLSPLVLLGYSIVEWLALHELMIRGKEVCNHKASRKTHLAAK